MNTPKQNFIGIAGWLIRVLLILPNALLVEIILLLAAVAALFFFPRCACHIYNAAQALPSFGWYFRNKPSEPQAR